MSLELLFLLVLCLFMAILLWRSFKPAGSLDAATQAALQQLAFAMQQQQQESLQKLERALVAQLQQQAQAGRQEAEQERHAERRGEGGDEGKVMRHRRSLVRRVEGTRKVTRRKILYAAPAAANPRRPSVGAVTRRTTARPHLS